MNTQNQSSGVKLHYGEITIDEVKQALNPDKFQAQIRQIVTREYMGVRSHDSLSDGLFSADEFGDAAEPQVYEEKRVTWVDVPKGSTEEEVAKRLASFPNARLVKILSLKPILSDEQVRAMETGLSKNANGSPKTIEDYKERQMVRNTESNEPVLYNGLPQYRVIKFHTEKVEDIDKRPQEYASLQKPSAAEKEDFFSGEDVLHVAKPTPQAETVNQ